MEKSRGKDRLRRDAEAIFRAGLRAVDSKSAVKRFLRKEGHALTIGSSSYDLSAYENVYVVGAGKASAAMAQAVEEILGDRISTGIVNVKYDHSLPLDFIAINEARHPVPDGAGLEGTQRIVELVTMAGQRDLVLCLISGGGSALLPYPADGISLAEKRQLTQILLEIGATIHEINVLRKHASRVKGGQLARLAYPSTLVTLIISDVVGDDLDSIASGPTVPDRSTYADCLRILQKYSLENKIPEAIRDHYDKGADGYIAETPKFGDPVFHKTQNVIIASNSLAIEAAARKAEELGYNSLILSASIEGEAKDVALDHAAVAREILQMGTPMAKPASVISGGETTVTIRGKGKGGRNQEFVLAAAIAIDGLENVVVLSAGTDGTDGPTDAAGAFADGATVRRARNQGLDAPSYLRNNDSFTFFDLLHDLFITGPTFTNVMDLRVVLVGD
ncbi:MAG: glycerate kinase [Candidatus Aminicenantes bacterium]|jgi:hydroxypyruvate reductase